MGRKNSNLSCERRKRQSLYICWHQAERRYFDQHWLTHLCRESENFTTVQGATLRSTPNIKWKWDIQLRKCRENLRIATISDIKAANKMMKFIKDNKNHMTFPPLHFPSTKVVMYSDASLTTSLMAAVTEETLCFYLAKTTPHAPSPGSPSN